MAAPARVLSLLITGTLAAGAAYADDVRLTVYPRVALNDGVRIEVFVPRHKDNRRLRVEMDGPLSRAFEESLEGENARATFPPLIIDRLPEGRYVVMAGVYRIDGTVKTTRVEFCRGAGCFADTP